MKAVITLQNMDLVWEPDSRTYSFLGERMLTGDIAVIYRQDMGLCHKMQALALIPQGNNGSEWKQVME